ncbi:MAG: ShlB/FhaC/HecB family hemolysin secretion/activation protein, partial [Methylobacterium sp.]|nr:ShlB/FhaC/HecB family hemolysin secretion/activation protein [Methylobacterium sp.]
MLFQRKQTGWLIALALAAQAPLAWAEESPVPAAAANPVPAATVAPPVIETAPAPVVFQINEFRVEGNTLLAPERIQALTQPFTGPGRDFGSVQGALEALQKEYQRIGRGAVQVILPEQELDQGIVNLQVVEQSIARITITGNEHFDNDNILRALPHVREGEIPNTGAISRDLRLANENPAKRTAVLFRSSDGEDEGLEATVKVSDEKPWKVFLSADNTGTSSTGFGRLGFGFQHYNVGNMDHRFTAQVVTNMSWPQGDKLIDREVKIFGFGYTIPFHELGDSLDMFAGYSNVNAGNPAGGGGLPFNVTGVGRVFGVHYNHNLDKIDNYTHKLRGGIDYHAYRTSNTLDAALTPKLTT